HIRHGAWIMVYLGEQRAEALARQRLRVPRGHELCMTLGRPEDGVSRRVVDRNTQVQVAAACRERLRIGDRGAERSGEAVAPAHDAEPHTILEATLRLDMQRSPEQAHER